MIGRNGERRSGISAQAAQHDDDDDIREQVEKKAIQLEYCESKNMADMLSKALLSSQFVKLREMLGVRKIIEQV